MREIKFRVWDRILKRMLSWEWVHDNFFSRIFDYPNMIPMQFTGLKDKNGKEVYEGDIITILKPLAYGWWPVMVEVRYSAPEFCVNYGQDNALHSSCEVIGNIYENPELLGIK